MENTYVAQKKVLQLTVQFQGVLQNTTPKPQPNPGPQLIICLNGTVQSVVHLPKPQSSESIEAELRDDHDKPFKGIDNLQKQVQHYLDKTGGTKCDQEDGPDWMFDKGEVTVRAPDYVFCPAPHRKQILCLFTRHFCQHPLFAEHDGCQTRKEICQEAVWQMYNFCSW